MSIKKRHRVPRCVILDFHDSYTRNLLRLFHLLLCPDSSDARDDVVGDELGISPADWQDRVVVINVDSITWTELTQDIIPQIDCLILGPGPGSPDRELDFSWSEALIKQYGHALPIFGLCLGHQGLATAFGGKITKAVVPSHGISTAIHHSKDGIFDNVVSPFQATQYNSLVVDETCLPDVLLPIAWKHVGGKREIMALKHKTQPLWGVQFHPESICSTFGATILGNFLKRVIAFHGGKTIAANLPEDILSKSTRVRPHGLDHGVHHTYEIRSTSFSHCNVSPQQLFESVAHGDSLGRIWLDAARPADGPQRSHICLAAATFEFDSRDRSVLVRKRSSSTTVLMAPTVPDFSSFSSWFMQRLQRSTRSDAARRESLPLGLVGSLGYECQDRLPSGPPAPNEARKDAHFAFVDRVLTYHHDERTWTGSALVRLDEQAEWGLTQDDWACWQREVQSRLQDCAYSPVMTPVPLNVAHHLEPDLKHKEYIKAIKSAQRSIVAGESYELCLTTTFRGSCPDEVERDPYRLYLALRENNPAPYCAFFDLPQSDLCIMSSSPERFMRIDRKGQVDMKPIKGTVARSVDPTIDEERRRFLEQNTKDRAENLMIVDLARNDMLAFCDVESVIVPKFMKVESFQTVHQLVTTITGKLSHGITNVQAVTSAFPPGSMTGAPKVRSVQLLDKLENRSLRGVYSGVFGYFGIDGSADFAVVIRTLVLRNKELTLGAGGAITHLSDPESEWQEVLTKVNAVLGRDGTR